MSGLSDVRPVISRPRQGEGGPAGNDVFGAEYHIDQVVGERVAGPDGDHLGGPHYRQVGHRLPEPG